jgi:hypothetical protein
LPHVKCGCLGGFVGELLSHNVFAYCQNDPINHADPSGFARLRIMDDSGNYSYEWGGAVILVPETGGASSGGAALLP